MKENGKLFKAGNEVYSPKNPLIIAELGTSHNGEIKKAREMINAAKASGASCVKFQMVYADEILHPNTGIVPLPGGQIRLYDRFKALELEADFYLEIKEYTESMGLLFLCTPFGKKSASILHKMNPKLVKIASPELNFTSLLEEIAGWELQGTSVPTLLSSGVSKLADIERAIEILRNKEFTTDQHEPIQTEGEKQNTVSCDFLFKNICLLHCVTSYPAPETDYNLRLIPNLASIFGVSAGVSDHSADPVLIPALSVAMGASVIEKHFCLSRNDPGLDDPIALEPQDFSKMVAAVKQAASLSPEETISRYIDEKGEPYIEAVLGDGVKKLAPSEEANYRLTNRSIHALRDIEKGEVLKRSDYDVLRTEKVLRPGLEPIWEGKIDGRVIKNFIPSGEGIRFDDL